VQVGNCSSNVMPIEARKVSLIPGVPTQLMPPIELYVSDSEAVPDRTCWITLFNSQVMQKSEMLVAATMAALVF
jgi:hypothetical protein